MGQVTPAEMPPFRLQREILLAPVRVAQELEGVAVPLQHQMPLVEQVPAARERPDHPPPRPIHPAPRGQGCQPWFQVRHFLCKGPGIAWQRAVVATPTSATPVAVHRSLAVR